MGSEPQQYAVGHRANLEQSAIERAMGPVRQVSSIDIGLLESEMKATGKDMAKDREIISLMRKADGKGNGNGRLDVTEAVAIIHDTAESRLNLKRVRIGLIVAIAIIFFLLLGNGCLIALVTAIFKDTYIKGDTTMSNANGEVVRTGVATHDLPLLVAPVLPDDQLSSVETIRVTLPGRTPGPIEFGSGEAVNEVGPSEINWFRISRVQKINSTVVVFHALGGETIRVWNGVTTVRLSATGPEIPVCSSNVTCAAFQVEGAKLAEKYLAEAEALLEPFVDGRRRLAEACLATKVDDPLCRPTTPALCAALASRNGQTYIMSGYWGYIDGCYSHDDGNHLNTAYFGLGGSDVEKLELLGNRPSHEYRIEQRDLACLDPYVNSFFIRCIVRESAIMCGPCAARAAAMCAHSDELGRCIARESAIMCGLCGARAAAMCAH